VKHEDGRGPWASLVYVVQAKKVAARPRSRRNLEVVGEKRILGEIFETLFWRAIDLQAGAPRESPLL
jgi:hypothetical protein